MERYAYIRVSTKEQNIDRQILALQPYNVAERNIYCLARTLSARLIRR